MDKKLVTPVSQHLPYDDSLNYQCQIYDDLPYMWDANLDIPRPITAVSGNIIKSYRCCIVEPYEIKN